jgi:hypothetical protein
VLNLTRIRLLALFLVGIANLFAVSPTLISRSGRPITPSGASTFGGPWEINAQAVPTSATDVAAVTSHIVGMWIHNPTGGSSITLTFKDKQGTPQPLPLDGQVITAGQDVVFNAPFGVLASGGMTITASGAGLTYSIVFTH